MKGLRTWTTFVAAIIAIALAGAASAAQPTKQWSITVDPPTFSTTSNVSVSITIKNETPNGNSTINSLKLILPTGYTVDTTDHPSAAVSTTWPGQLDWTSQSGVIAFSNMSPLKPQASFTMTAFLNVNTSQAGCAQTAWGSSIAWTGSSFSGDTFLLTFSTGTSVSPNNLLAFQSVTSNVAVGTPVTGSVHATSCATDASGASVTVKMTNSSNVVVDSPITSSTNASGIVSFSFPTSALPAGTYTLTASATNYTTITTTVTVCGNSLAFAPAPSNVALGTPVSTSIQVNSCGTLTSGVGVTAKVKDSGGNVVAGPTTVSSNASGLAAFQFTVSPNGTYTVEASATNYGLISAPVTVFDGTLNCNEPIAAKFINPQNLAPDQPGYAAGTRNPYNKDGVSEECVPVLYTFTNNILNTDSTGNTVNLTWDTKSQPNAAFEYTLNWQAQPVEAASSLSGWPMTIRPSVAWLNQDGSETTGLSTNPAFVPGLACLGNKLPAPYGTLVNNVDDQPGTTSLTVTGIASNPHVINPLTGTDYTQPVPGAPAIPAYPFPIVIANTVGGQQATATERMLVTGDTARASSSGVWTITFTVQRGNGLMPRAPHGAGYRVMSTPLPLIPTDDAANFPAGGIYAPGTQAHMCIASHGFTAFSFEAGRANVLYQTHVFDVGDGWVLGR